MNGDEKEEAHRPRPLSAGIWTLFSWLRRSERSSSSESVSSVGSARTAVSFDFLAPGNYNITSPIVLTTPLNPPTETYKRRLQERNLRRQRDRDVTLHRKYGLFREHGFEGFTLPVTRRPQGSTFDRSNRERRATSECLQRRAAYVPGKRRAPLPPTITSSASLPRTYKRKRQAPKPPIKNTKDNINIVQLVDNSVRMTSNSESEAKFVPDSELSNNTKAQKFDKKVTTAKDTKSRTDKNFLRHIFENRKRSSVIDTTSVRLLPSISELDKQATEIIENNKLRQKKNNVDINDFNNLQDSTALYEGNSWFCTSCLRKYNSSIDTCDYCRSDKKYSLKKDGFQFSSPRSSIYTQTNVNIETSSSSRNSVEEQKMLKEILKEMKDSLPKKNKDKDKINRVITEIPTLKIGSTVQETYKDYPSQPSSSSKNSHNKHSILSTSPLLPHKKYDEKKNTNQPVVTSTKSTESKSAIQYKVTSALENKSTVLNTSAKISLNPHEPLLSTKDENGKKRNDSQSQSSLRDKTGNNDTHEINITKTAQNKNINNLDSVIIKNTSPTQNLLPLPSTETNDSKEVHKSNPQVLSEVSNNGRYENRSTKPVTNKITKSDNVLPNSSKLPFLNLPQSSVVVVNNVTVLTAHSNNKSSETSNKILVKNAEKSVETKIQSKTKITDLKLQSTLQTNTSHVTNAKTTNPTYLEPKANIVEVPETSSDPFKLNQNLHTPLKISSLLNPLYTPSKTIVKENVSTESDASKHFHKQLSTNVPKTTEINQDNLKQNKTEHDKTTTEIKTSSANMDTTYLSNNSNKESQIKETVETQPRAKNATSKDEKILPSTSGCSSSVTINTRNQVDKLDHYDRRRQLINQLEQSIAKGDEVAAAEAAVNLAKLKLSCSVLSFSSQIVGETSSGIKKEKNKNIAQITNTTSLKDKPLELKTPEVIIANTTEHADIAAVNKNQPVEKLIENKKVTENNAAEPVNGANVKPHLMTSEPSTSRQVISDDVIPINVWIEDKQAARGPIRLNISRGANVADLRRQAEQTLGLATQLQRWIVGRTLCSDDATPIVSLAGPYFRAPFYLCIVQPDQSDKPVTTEVINDGKNNGATDQNGEFYTELMKLEKQSLVPNIEPFECGVCMEECAAGAGVILRECIHTFCRECLSDVVQHSQEPVVACPATSCSGFLQEREIRTIVTPEEYERWLARGLATAECGTRNAFHCRTRDCTGWAFCDPGVRRFPCPVCKKTNCVQCQAIHEGETCEQYQTKLRQAVTAAETNKDDEGTQALLNSLISRGEALECPECRSIITKKWGCDWVKCSACKTEICWVTKGRRWGSAGRGDTSGGCRCGVDGQRCHPSCGYCH